MLGQRGPTSYRRCLPTVFQMGHDGSAAGAADGRGFALERMACASDVCTGLGVARVSGLSSAADVGFKVRRHGPQLGLLGGTIDDKKQVSDLRIEQPRRKEEIGRGRLPGEGGTTPHRGENGNWKCEINFLTGHFGAGIAIPPPRARVGRFMIPAGTTFRSGGKNLASDLVLAVASGWSAAGRKVLISEDNAPEYCVAAQCLGRVCGVRFDRVGRELQGRPPALARVERGRLFAGLPIGQAGLVSSFCGPCGPRAASRR